MTATSPKPVELSRPALIPVVELEPIDFATTTRSSPGRSGLEVPEEWYAYWKASIADRGLSLEPLPLPGSWSVALDDLMNASAIATIAKIAGGLETDSGETSSIDDLHVLPGGYALGDGDAFVWHAACCAGLQDLSEWSALLTAPPQTQFLGHTWVRSTTRETHVELGLRGEYESAESKIFLVDSRHVDGMLVNARARVQRFRERLYEALRGHVPEGSRRLIADSLTRDR